MIGMALSFCSSLNQMSARASSAIPPPIRMPASCCASFCRASSRRSERADCCSSWPPGAEPLYREAFPARISLGNLFAARGLRTKRFFLGSILGITLTGIFIAYQTGFYIVAYKFGAWSPADVPYSDLLNTQVPLAVRAVRRLSAGRFGGVSLPHVRHPVPAETGALHRRRSRAGRLHLGLRARGVSAAAVLHPRRGSGHRRRGAGAHHAALGDPAHAGLALLGGRDVQRHAAAALAEPLFQALRERPARESWCSRC